MDTSACMSPVSMVSMSDFGDSPSRNPPPYRPPPQAFSPSGPSSPAISSHVPASMHTVGLPILEAQTKVQYKDCVNEFQQAMSSFLDSNRVDVTSRKNSFEQIIEEQQTPPSLPPRKRTSIDHRSISRENSVEQAPDDNKENMSVPDAPALSTAENEENKMSVREAMMKFNRYASEEEAKIPSPLSKPSRKLEKVSLANFHGNRHATRLDLSMMRLICPQPPSELLTLFCFSLARSIAMTRQLRAANSAAQLGPLLKPCLIIIH